MTSLAPTFAAITALVLFRPAFAQDVPPGEGWEDITEEALSDPDADQDPDAAEDEPNPADGMLDEVIVFGEHRVAEAREHAVRAIKSQGWREHRRNDEGVVFRGPKPWMGRIILRPDATLRFAGAGIGVGTGDAHMPDPRSPGAAGSSINSGPNAAPLPGAGARVPVQVGGKSKREAVQSEVRAAVVDELSAYRDAIRQRALSQRVESLPDKLDRLWADGTPLWGGSPLSTPGERRRAVLDHWATRTDTAEGRAISRIVELWLGQTVQRSEHPVTDEERRAAEARRSDGRKLDLD